MGLSSAWIEWLTVVIPGLIVLGVSGWGLFRWYQRHQFIVGVPPNKSEQQKFAGLARELGRKSITSEFLHNKECFAKKQEWYNRWSKLQTLPKKLEDALYNPPRGREFNSRCRYITLSSDGEGWFTASLPVIVENCGKRAARDYFLAIHLLRPEIHIIDIKTESLSVNTFYCDRRDLVKNDELKEMACDDIRKEYNNYLHTNVGTEYGDMVYLTGQLEAKVYEMVILNVLIHKGELDSLKERKFVIRYIIDCSDGWVSSQTFFQGFIIEN
jgi:hypothetical protein